MAPYDYNAILDSIVAARQGGKLQEAVQAFSDLSSKCPMTPLLWMQYAFDNQRLMDSLNLPSSAVIRLQTLELGVAEFPGSLLLRLHYLELLVQHESDDSDTVERAFRNALESFARGSHANEDMLLLRLFRLYGDFLVQTKGSSEALKAFAARASCPMKEGNDSLADELQRFCNKHRSEIELTASVEESVSGPRRDSGSVWGGFLQRHCDDIEVAMSSEGILYDWTGIIDNDGGDDDDDNSNDDTDQTGSINWERLLLGSTEQSFMGLGGAQSAKTFQKFAQACTKAKTVKRAYDTGGVRIQEEKKHGESIKLLTLDIFERGLAETPTVESLWLAYMKALSYMILNGYPAFTERLQSVAARAVRNCPYSLNIAKQQLEVELVVCRAKGTTTTLDPKSLFDKANETYQIGFLPGAASLLELYLTAVRVVRRRVLFLLDKDYDQTVQDPMAKPKPVNIPDASYEEIQDLAEDLDDMYEQMDARIRKTQDNWTEGRAMLWKEWGIVQQQLQTPILQEDDDDESNGGPSSQSSSAVAATNTKILTKFDKTLKLHQPAHPDCFTAYIGALMAQPPPSISELPRKFRKIRALYQRAINACSRPQSKPLELSGWRHFETARHTLCQDFLSFELLYGSEQSYVHASRHIAKNASKQQRSREQAQQTQQPAQQIPEATPATKDAMDYQLEQDTGNESVPLDKKIAPESISPKKRKNETLKDDGKAADNNDTVVAKEEPTRKKARVEEQPDVDAQPMAVDSDSSKMIDDEEEEKKKKNTKKGATKQQPKVRVGKMDYPAHPFTVRVSNLSPDAQDMDLVDLLKPKCGSIVHARIMRERGGSNRGASKGWALVQFEDCDSVDQALALHDTLGLHEKLLAIERSHVAAVGLVPPGMHRVKPKGEGKVSRRNEKRKEQFGSTDDDADSGSRKKRAKTNDVGPASDLVRESNRDATKQSNDKTATTAKETKPKKESGTDSVFAFQPRGVSRNRKRKAKLDLTKSDL